MRCLATCPKGWRRWRPTLNERYRGFGGTAILFSETCTRVHAGGYLHTDLVQIGMANDKMQRELQDLGINFYKMHRVYRRLL